MFSAIDLPQMEERIIDARLASVEGTSATPWLENSPPFAVYEKFGAPALPVQLLPSMLSAGPFRLIAR